MLSDEQAEEVAALLTPDKELPPLPHEAYSGKQTCEKDSEAPTSELGSSLDSSVNSKSNVSGRAINSALDKLDSLVFGENSPDCSKKELKDDNDSQDETEPKTVYERPKPNEESYYDEEAKVHYYSDGHYWFEIHGLDSTESANMSPSERLPPGCYKKPGRLRFSTEPMKQYSTFAVDDYDRRNDEVDPVAASGTTADKNGWAIQE